MVEHSTADREVTGSNPIAPFNSLSLLFSVPKVYPPIYDVPATTECLMAESGSHAGQSGWILGQSVSLFLLYYSVLRPQQVLLGERSVGTELRYIVLYCVTRIRNRIVSFFD